MQFEIRPYASPVFTGTYQVGGPVLLNWDPVPGNTVSLKSQGVSVTVKIKTAASQQYTGEIEDFDSGTEEFEGKSIGDLVEFTYDNIFSCTR